MACTILMYHKVDPRFEMGVTRVLPGQFRAQMKWLRDNDLRGVGLREAWDAGGLSSIDPSTVIITFDDGYESVYRNAWPVLQECGFTATVFVVTEFVGITNTWDVNWGGRGFKHLDWRQITEMQAGGISFGSHGATHSDLTRMDPSVCREEIVSSKARLEDALGASCDFFSYPFGRASERVRDLVRESGYSAACTVRRMGSSRDQDPYALPRTGVYLLDSLAEFTWKVTRKGLLSDIEGLKAGLISRCSLGTVLFRRWVRGVSEVAQ